ncbi:S-layer homology domain-containing protein [Paenibacillus sp. yr247]|uniref:S-layer homology domain-containing protein n=1 Tax=Paenibacillus sp. yr247 TaxID=1761880 RepID=UPI000880D454|nr:S-layer homology domain-containing protein [Paenibacillus sp. yr247]SDO15853.1 S-layer homology domain-containing protein [Paenibacillus sp. yr247]
MTMKKVFIMGAALSVVMSSLAFADGNTSSFPDMRDHWAKTAVETAVKHKYVDGYSDGSFRPENYVTGAEFIKMVVTASGLMVEGSTEGSQWYVPYVKAAVAKGFVREDTVNDKFLKNPISRLEMAKIAVRATDPMLQQPQVSLNDQGVMYTATSKGLVQGLSGGDLAPEGSTTRAQSVTIIERILSTNAGEKLPIDKYAIGQAELQLKRTNMFSMIPSFSGEQIAGHSWSPEKLVVETPDHNYKGEIDQVVAIDLEDSNDPNRYMLGDINSLRVYDGGDFAKKMPYVKDFPKSYVILVKSHTVFNNDTSSYSSKMYGLGMSFTGFKMPNSQNTIINGELRTLTWIFKEKFGDMGAYIVPKDVAAPMGVDIQVYVPAIPPVSDMTHTITSTQRAVQQ